MADRTRAYLKQEFNDGERPTGIDFKDLIDSFINKEDDNIKLDTNGNFAIPNGLNLSDAVVGQPGTLRFNGGQLQIFDGGAWNPVGGGGGAFQPVGVGQDVAYTAGNVGVGAFAPAPTHKLQVETAANTGEGERIKLGQLVVHNANNNSANICHVAHANNDNRFALRQDDQGNTTISANNNAQLALQQEGTTRVRVSTQGEVIITPNSVTSMAGDLRVTGNAFKPGGGPWQNLASDARLKQDVRELDSGLSEILNLKPVYYKYNDKIKELAGDQEYVGLIAQDVQKILPSIVSPSPLTDERTKDLLTYDSGPLTFILIKAVQELADRVTALELQLNTK